METRKFKIKDRSKSYIKISDEGLYYKSFDSEFVLIGIIEKETKKGFYYIDMFFKKQFINWNSLEKIELQEEKATGLKQKR